MAFLTWVDRKAALELEHRVTAAPRLLRRIGHAHTRSVPHPHLHMCVPSPPPFPQPTLSYRMLHAIISRIRQSSPSHTLTSSTLLAHLVRSPPNLRLLPQPTLILPLYTFHTGFSPTLTNYASSDASPARVSSFHTTVTPLQTTSSTEQHARIPLPPNLALSHVSALLFSIKSPHKIILPTW